MKDDGFSTGSKILVFFLTCASVDYHYAILNEVWAKKGGNRKVAWG